MFQPKVFSAAKALPVFLKHFIKDGTNRIVLLTLLLKTLYCKKHIRCEDAEAVFGWGLLFVIVATDSHGLDIVPSRVGQVDN